MTGNHRNRGAGFKLAAFAFFLLASVPLTLLGQDSYRRGQHVEPAYEGWRPNEDGTFSFLFGYMNENWEAELDVTVGTANFFPLVMQTAVNPRTSCRAAIASPIHHPWLLYRETCSALYELTKH